MLFNYAYRGSSQVSSGAQRTEMSFSPDLKRDPTYFVGELGKRLEFREAISALHDVVVSDLRFKPKDRTAYKEWAARQEQIDWVQVAKAKEEVAERIQKLSAELRRLWDNSTKRMQPFYDAKQKFFRYLYEKERDLWFVLDPVITVHPDEVFFECFSQDESAYGRLGAGYEVFHSISEFACGTTNIDYSTDLYNEFQKIRSYKGTQFKVDPSGFEVKTQGDDEYKEVKIDLPESWVRGFLQVSSAMSLPTMSFELHPMDIYNVCFLLRRFKEKRGPRSLRYHLKPGEPVKIVLEPWEREIICGRTRYEGGEDAVVRVWGRRRLLTLERLIPIAKKFTVHLLGTGLPSFYIADLGDMSFTLGLSGWTANDWSSACNFDLMAPRSNVELSTKVAVFNRLKRNWSATAEQLSREMGLDRATVLGALSSWTQAGRAIYDLNRGVYRARELSREPLPLDKLRYSNAREETASKLVNAGSVERPVESRDFNDCLKLEGRVTDAGKTYEVSLTIDSDERLIWATCNCSWYVTNKLYKGPCEHILAVRLARNR